MCGVADGRDRDFDLLRFAILTGRMSFNPKPDSMVEGRSSSTVLDSDAMLSDDYVFIGRIADVGRA